MTRCILNITMCSIKEDCNINDVVGIGDFENVEILKEREGDNLGDGNISGFPKMEISDFQDFTISGFEILKFHIF